MLAAPATKKMGADLAIDPLSPDFVGVSRAAHPEGYSVRAPPSGFGGMATQRGLAADGHRHRSRPSVETRRPRLAAANDRKAWTPATLVKKWRLPALPNAVSPSALGLHPPRQLPGIPPDFAAPTMALAAPSTCSFRV